MTVKKPWTEMTPIERFTDDFEGFLLARADAKDVKEVIERLTNAVASERRATVERIRSRLVALAEADAKNPPANPYFDEAVMIATPILDEEAAR